MSRHKGAGEKQAGVELRYKVSTGAATVYKVAWSPDGSVLALLQSDGVVQIREAATGGLLRTMEVIRGKILDVAWASNGQVLATVSDEVIQLWSGNTGVLLKSFESRFRGITAVAWSPDGQLITSAHSDGVIRLWDSEHGTLVDLLKEHTGEVTGVTWSPNGQTLASYAADKTIRLWERATGRLLKTIKVKSEPIYLAWSTDGHVIAAALGMETIHLWNPLAGREEGIIEGHTDRVTGLSFSPDGRLLASISRDGSVRLWDRESWDLRASFKVSQGKRVATGGLAFHPKTSLLAALAQSGREACLWSLDTHAALHLPSGIKSIRYVTAKVSLIGNGGVGKTSLGWRLMHDEFKMHPSTHGQNIYLAENLGSRRSDGAECEVVLCDSAGQPDYRLVNALFLSDTDLALLVFDATDRGEPLKGAEYWVNQLPSDESRARRKILVGTKIDDGPLAVTPAELESFCSRHNIEGGYVLVSALTGEGLDELRERLRAEIGRVELTSVLTTAPFNEFKEAVLSLKKDAKKWDMIVSYAGLRRRLKWARPTLKLSDEEMTAVVSQLAKHNYVALLPSPSGAASILLAPDRLITLAASLVHHARNHPSGLGTLDEDEFLLRVYDLPELAGLKRKDQELLADAAIALFLKRGVCFREVLGQKTLLIFPSLVRQEKPPEDGLGTEEDFSYVVRGAVESVYATLAALLGYTNIFARASQWRKRAEYLYPPREVCGFKQLPGRQSGEVELVLYYGADVQEGTRNLFRGLFEKHLVREGLSFERYAPAVCANPDCGYRQERTLIFRRRLEKKEHLCCSECGEVMKLPQGEVLTPALPRSVMLRRDDEIRLKSEGARAGLRVKFEEALMLVKSLARRTAASPPTCFISYAWGEDRHERWVRERLADDLAKAGIEVILDDRDNAEIGANIARFISRIGNSDYVVAVGTPLYLRKCENEDPQTGSVVSAELDLMNQRLTWGTEREKRTVLPLLLEGDERTALPHLMRGKVYGDFRQPERYFATLFDLIVTIHQLRNDHPSVSSLRKELRKAEELPEEET